MDQNNSKPKISIIVPVFNTENYIPRCLDSILNQSEKDFELLIVNDLSTDNSEKLIEQYQRTHSCIKYFKMTKRGLAGGTRNLALENASGKYIGFTDSDDWVDTNMFKSMIEALESNNSDIAICGINRENESNRDAVKTYSYKSSNCISGPFALDLMSRRYNQDISVSSIVSNKVYRNSFLKNNNLNFLSNSYNEDDLFNFICFTKASKVSIVADCYYHYFQRKNSITQTFSKKHIDDLIDAFTKLNEQLVKDKTFQVYKENYYSYFDKCLGFVLSLLSTHEESSVIQSKYLNYLLEKGKNILMPGYLEYIGLSRINKIYR